MAGSPMRVVGDGAIQLKESNNRWWLTVQEAIRNDVSDDRGDGKVVSVDP